MFTHTTIAQEITLQAYAFGVFDILFNKLDMGRDVVFNTFEDWATEFEQEEEKHRDDPDWFFFDEIDKLILRKKTELEKED